jgi:hypothetical protein
MLMGSAGKHLRAYVYAYAGVLAVACVVIVLKVTGTI